MPARGAHPEGLLEIGLVIHGIYGDERVFSGAKGETDAIAGVSVGVATGLFSAKDREYHSRTERKGWPVF